MPVLSQDLRRVSFKVGRKDLPEARWVAVVGPFNHWNIFAHRLTLGADGWWSIDLWLPPGIYPYLLVVDGCLSQDPGEQGRLEVERGQSYSLRMVA